MHYRRRIRPGDAVFLIPCVVIPLLMLNTCLSRTALRIPKLAPGSQHQQLTADGAWCWFADPRAVHHSGQHSRDYVAWVTSKGDIVVGGMENDKPIEPFVLHKGFQKDDHDVPALLFLPDQRLMAFYSKHGGPEMYCRVTKRPEDIREWEPERTLDLYGRTRKRKTITYPNPVMLASAQNEIWLFWRGDNWKPTFSISKDLGKTWSPAKTLVSRKGANNYNRPYAKIGSDHWKRIHIAFTDGHPRNEKTNSIYYLQYEDGVFQKADGTRIGTLEDLPFQPKDCDLVYDAKTTGARAWIWDVCGKSNGDPVLAYTRHPTEEDHRYHYAQFRNGAWHDRELVASGGWFPETPQGKREPEPHYSGGLILDHEEPGYVLLSRIRDGQFEIEAWRSTDEGRSWKFMPITKGSSKLNVRPFIVRRRGEAPRRLLWMEGNYRHYVDFHTSIRTAVWVGWPD